MQGLPWRLYAEMLPENSLPQALQVSLSPSLSLSLTSGNTRVRAITRRSAFVGRCLFNSHKQL